MDQLAVKAGEWLVSLCARESSGSAPGSRVLTPFEKAKLDEYFSLYRRHPFFREHHVEALRCCLARGFPGNCNPDYGFARLLLAEDDANDLLVDQPDMLHVAIKSSLINPELLGRPHEESCPGLIPMLKDLMAHGASVSSLDKDGRSPLYYACVLGARDLFDFLIASGASTTTTHARVPYNPHSYRPPLPESQDQTQDAESGSFNLLQVTLDAFVSPYRLTRSGGSSWSFEGGYGMYVHLQLDRTWGGIIMHLIKDGLTCTRDDPGLVLLLHVACVQGDDELVTRLLDSGVPVTIASPRMSFEVIAHGELFSTAMLAAAANMQLSTMKLLLERGGEKPQQGADSGLKTPVEMALLSVKLAHREHEPDTMRKLAEFLEDLTQLDELLNGADYQRLIGFGIQQNRIGLTADLLRRGFRPPEAFVISSKDMAQLLFSHGIVLNPAKVQADALQRNQVDLLRWCVGEFGPHLPEDDDAWEDAALGALRSEDLSLLRYLVCEYPGPHIDAIHCKSSGYYPGDKPTPTSWLHLAASGLLFEACRVLLEAGADPTCPGLSEDASTAIRRKITSVDSFRNLGKKLDTIRLLEFKAAGDAGWSPPTYSELRDRLASTFAKERQAWDRRTREQAEEWTGLPFSQPATANTTTTSSAPMVEAAGTPSPLYSSLSGSSAFRLLELLPVRSRTDPLEARLVVSDVAFQPDFEALSYTWGAATDSHQISINGHILPIMANLHAALKHLRHAEDVRTLWADAICIDQSSLSERAQQVALMGDIYRSARQVVVWLGEAADDSHLVFSHVRRFKEKRAKFAEIPPPTPAEERAWKAVMLRAWFFRTWILQEIGLSRQAVIVCGDDSMPWEDFRFVSAKDSKRPPGYSGFTAGFRGERHVNSLKDLDGRRGGRDPVSVMLLSRTCQSTEVRDRVYGLLGLFDPGLVPVDYSLPVPVIFRQFTEAIIRRTGSLRMLSYLDAPGPRMEGLPSWVPDFTNRSSGGILHSYRHDAPLQGIELRGDALVFRGSILDTVLELGDLLPTDMEFGPGTSAFAGVIRSWESVAANIAPSWQGDASLTRAFALTLTAGCGDKDMPIDAGFVAWYRHRGHGLLEVADQSMLLRDCELYHWWATFGKNQGEAEGPNKQDKPETQKPMEPDDDDDDEDGREETPEEAYIKMATARQQAFARIRAIYFGPREEGLCSRELEGFADNMESACYGRRLFSTEGGSMGLAGPRARAGDRIVSIVAGQNPLVLRRREDGKGWTVLGDCYFYGLEGRKDEGSVEEYVIR